MADGESVELVRLRHENFVLKKYAEKVTKEIQRYQSKGVVPRDVADPEGLPLPDLGSLTPLLQAYEERLRDLEGVLNKSVSLSEQMQELLKENKELRAQIQDRATEDKRPSDYLLFNQENEEKEDFAHLYQLAQEQNEVLLQQNEMMKATIERIEAERGAQGMQAAQDRRMTQEARVVAKTQEECAGYLQQQRDAAEAKLGDVLSELVEQKRDFETVQRELEIKMREWRMERKSMEEFRATYEERLKQALRDADETNKENERVTKQAQESRMRCMTHERMCYDLEEKLRLSRKETDATKSEAENMLVLMEGFEKRLKDSTALHEETKAELLEHVEQTDGLIAERDRNQLLETTAREQLKRMEVRVSETREALARTLEDKTEGVRRHLTKKVAQMEEEIRSHDQMLADDKVKLDVQEKQKAYEVEQWSRKVKLLEAESKSLERNADMLHETVLQLEETKHTLEMDSGRFKRESSEQIAALTAKLRALEASSLESQNALASTKQQLQEKTLACEQSMLASQSIRQRFDTLWNEHQAEKNLRAESEDQWRAMQVEEISVLQREWKSELQRSREAEEEAVELLRAQEDFWAQKDEELTRGKDGLHDQIDRLKRQNMELRLSQIAN
eukprot:GEMP01008317.1.p1 GENE.GEMP01008317.1~~GEMP01008317.1.p1  ORF type:complete len:621 (+),score=212.12 GEMP01008317.1:151-2013(+)